MKLDEELMSLAFNGQGNDVLAKFEEAKCLLDNALKFLLGEYASAGHSSKFNEALQIFQTRFNRLLTINATLGAIMAMVEYQVDKEAPALTVEELN